METTHRRIGVGAWGRGAAALIAAAALAGGCASGGAGEYEENAIVHQVSKEDEAFAKSKTPIDASRVTLWVNGLGCPLCATNIDRQIERVKGVQAIAVDLSSGRVGVDLRPGARPSPWDFWDAVDAAGFTLVKVEVAGPAAPVARAAPLAPATPVEPRRVAPVRGSAPPVNLGGVR